MDMPEVAAVSAADGAAPNPMLGALIGALAGNAPLDPFALLQQQLGGPAQGNPQIAQLLMLMEQRRKEQAQAAEAQEQEQEQAQDDESDGDEAASHQIDETVRQVYSELDALRARSRAFAAAVGACAACFGEDPLCTGCGGRGTPGRRAPDPDAFRHYLLPALRRAQSVETERRRRGARPEREPRSGPGACAPAGGASTPH